MSSPEARVDTALNRGNLLGAEALLLSGIKQHYSQEPHHYHPLALKHIALPFYELTGSQPDQDSFDRAANVYAWSGNLLESELTYNALTPNHTELSAQSVGRLSELIVFSLLARDVSPDSTLVPLPSSQADDINYRQGTDFYLAPVHGRSERSYRLQVKTRLTEQHRRRYDPSISLIGLNQLDQNYYIYPAHSSSLAQTILRELAGQASSEDIDRLNSATAKLYTGLIGQTTTKSQSIQLATG